MVAFWAVTFCKVVEPKARKLIQVKAWRVVEPRRRNSPVVVAPPKMVRPVPVVPAPIVEEAVEFKPPKKWMRVVVD